jgi:HKD family nuclease
MDKSVISDQFSEAIDGRRVQAAVFTSYNFEPHFFEIDVIPYLLKDTIPYSNDERVKKYQVMEALRDSELEIEVFFDQPVFESADQSPAMEYLFHGINLLPFAFHAKNNYLLVKDKETEKQNLLIAAGSNNLTRAGWWENIETQHWVIIDPDKTNELFIEQLKGDMEWLKAHRNLKSSDAAIEKISLFINECKLTEPIADISYFDIQPGNFFSFIENSLSLLSKHSGWNLEIISPFFANDAESLLHEEFYKMGVENIVLLLPFDQDGKALCDVQYYETIRKADNISWGQWHNLEAKSLGVDKQSDQFRKLHAKIYHFYNEHESLIFSGSVNFTRNAIYRNVETGFLTKQPPISPLLKSVDEEIDVEFVNELNEQELQSEQTNLSYFDIHLGYDWKHQKLQGMVSKDLSLNIKLLNQEGLPITDNWLIGAEERTYEGDKSLLEGLLKQTGFINIQVQEPNSDNPAFEQSILVLQTGWSHKPVELPDLSPGEILLIYAGMSEERRQILLMNAKIKSFLSQNLGGELNASDDDKTHRQFFCEYAEIFHAFRHFKNRLLTLLNNNENKQLDYYLSGTGADSLPALIDKATDVKSESYNAVVSYLLLLSTHEILDSFKSRVNVRKIRATVNKVIIQLEKSDILILEKGTNRKKFFAWFREQFSKNYKKEPQLDRGE